MKNHEVVPAFEMLIEEMDGVMSDLNHEGAKLLIMGKYDEARSLIEKAKSIKAIQASVMASFKAWESIDVPKLKSPTLKPTISKKSSRNRLEKGLRTQEADFKIPLLKTLVAMGGSGKVSSVLDKMETLVKPILTKYDLEVLSSVNELRWRNTTKWARADMVKEGLLKNNSPYGVWEISSSGRIWLRQQEERDRRD